MKGWNIPRLSEDRLAWLANLDQAQRVTVAHALMPHSTGYDQAYQVISHFVEAAGTVLLLRGKRTDGSAVGYDFPKHRLKARLENINRSLPNWAKWK